MSYLVYWAHLYEQTDIKTEGYVGITLNFIERKRQHLKNRKKYPFALALKKYKASIIWDFIHTNLTLQEALHIEKQLRPTIKIGWNLQSGGELGVEKEWYHDPVNNEQHRLNTSLGTIKSIEKESDFERSQRAVISSNPTKLSESNSGSNNKIYLLTGEKHPAFGTSKTAETIERSKRLVKEKNDTNKKQIVDKLNNKSLTLETLNFSKYQLEQLLKWCKKENVTLDTEIVAQMKSFSPIKNEKKKKEGLPERKDGKFVCSEDNCNFETIHSGAFHKHKRIHIGIKEYKCDKCEYEAYCQTDVNKHFKQHHSKLEKIKCNFKNCPYETITYGRLEKHTLTHSNEKPFSCDKCDYVTKHISSLNRHIKTIHIKS